MESIPSIVTGTESYPECIARHKREMKDMDGKIRALKKTTKGSQKLVIESQIVQMQFDIKARHNDELDRFEDPDQGLV